MKVIIDLLTPKQCMFFSKLSDSLEKEGHQVFRTTRRYREVTQLLKLKGIDAITVGKHGGGTLLGKLRANTSRILELSRIVDESNPDIAVSFSSPEMARVAFGLAIPHVCINDSPHAEAVARLTIPLSKVLFAPKIIPKNTWVKYGISCENVIQYNALDPWAWLKGFKPDRKVLEKLNLDECKPILTFRTEESFAAYLLRKTSEEPSIVPVIKELIKGKEDFQIVIIPRYERQITSLRRMFKQKATICESVIDGPSLLHYTSIFVGAGGTMSIEAALLGVPTFSCYPGEPFLAEKYLMKRGLIIREDSPRETARRIFGTLKRLDHIKGKQSERTRELVEKFEDPIQVITDRIVGISSV